MADQAPILPRQLPPSLQDYPTVVAIGNFDGVHQGHQAVLREALHEARCRKLLPVALTFHPHPTQAVGRPSPACLTPIWRKVQLIARMDPSLHVIVQHFDLDFASIPPEQFIAQVLVQNLHAKAVRVGDNFRFGARRGGSLTTLVEAGKRYGFDAKAAPTAHDEHGRFSSTRIRSAIAAGHLDDARQMLGRPHALSGTVVSGQRRARHLGFPTANLRWIEEALPPRGVYTVAVELLGPDSLTKRLGLGVCNIGIRPTVDAGFAVETHILDFDEDLYDRQLRVHLLQRLRDEQKFTSLDELKNQIEADVARARTLLANVRPDPTADAGWF